MSGGMDEYYSTLYPKVFLHRFIFDGKIKVSAGKIIGRNLILHRVSKRILPIFGGIVSTSLISRRTMIEAEKDAKYLSKKTKEGKDVGKMHYTNETLFEKIDGLLKKTTPEKE